MTPTKPIIHIVDDDESFRNAVMRLLRAAGYETRSYPAAAGFLDAKPGGEPGGVLLDVQMPGLGGLDLQQTLATMENPLPVNLQVQAFGNVVKQDYGPDWQLRFQIQFLFPK
jgi:FixJ family two-component response regulator